MICWLAAYPRSGSTFIRIVLHEVYGIRSIKLDTGVPAIHGTGDNSSPVATTHAVPGGLLPDVPGIPVIYLIRDGRDALVSMAHHQADIVQPGHDYYAYLREAILAAEGSYWGGWSGHVKQWLERASLVLRYEEFIQHPIECIERMRPFIDLPEPDLAKLPTFHDLQTKPYPYVSATTFDSSEASQRHRMRFFRRGKVGSWKDEMPDELHQLFMKLHGDVLKDLGYCTDSKADTSLQAAMTPGPAQVCGGQTLASPPEPPGGPVGEAGIVLETSRARILIEATKLTTTPNMDGCKRYVIELLQGLRRQAEGGLGNELCVDVQVAPEATVSLFDERLTRVLQNESLEFADQPPPGDAERSQVLPSREALHREMQKMAEKWLVDVLPGEMSQFLMDFKRKLVRLKAHKNALLQTEMEPAGLEDLEPELPQGYELLHLTLPNNSHLVQEQSERWITTVHDLSHIRCPHFQRKDNIATLERGLRSTLANNSSYIAVSKATRDDLLTLYRVDPRQVFTIPEACDRTRFIRVQDREEVRRVLKKYRIPEKPYFFSVGTLEPRKNLANTIRAFSELIGKKPSLDVILVISGQRGWKISSLLEEPALQGNGRVVFTGYVEDEDLPVLYSGALAFCYVSHYEGFGLPVLEAMNCGTPVIYGNNSSMPEVALNGGLPAESEDVHDICEKMKRIAVDGELRDYLAWNALKRASIFSWDRTARKTIAAYRAVVGRRS